MAQTQNTLFPSFSSSNSVRPSSQLLPGVGLPFYPFSPDPTLLASSLLWPCLPYTGLSSPSRCLVSPAPLPHCSQVQLPEQVPGDRIAVHLQELQQLLGLLSISCLLLGSERVVGDQQGVGPTTWGGKDQKSGGWEGPRPLSLKWFLQLKAYVIIVIKTELK